MLNVRLNGNTVVIVEEKKGPTLYKEIKGADGNTYKVLDEDSGKIHRSELAQFELTESGDMPEDVLSQFDSEEVGVLKKKLAKKKREKAVRKLENCAKLLQELVQSEVDLPVSGKACRMFVDSMADMASIVKKKKWK